MGEICNAYQAHKNFPKIDTNSSEDVAEMIELFMEKANAALEPIQMQICKTQEEMKSINDNQTYTQYYVMAPTFENDTIAKLQKIYGEPELEWLKLVAGHLVDSEDKLANQNELINLCRDGGNNTMKKKLNVTEADKALNMFVEDGYLMKIRGSRKGFKLALGPRFHLYCVDRGNKDPKCPRCKTPLKIEGVASK